jgi:hypothetical protein
MGNYDFAPAYPLAKEVAAVEVKHRTSVEGL